ncbi:hypothetical protein HK098_005128, partial [Nowakowskiella sp. JEL0407]
DAPEPKASLFSKLTFGWVNPLIERTKVKVINESDIWELEDEQKTRTVIEEFQVSKKSYKGLVLRLIHVNFGLLCIQIALSSISSLLVFAGPFFLNRIILFIQNDADDQLEQGRYWGIVYVFALLLSNLLDSFLEGQIGILARKIGIRIRAAVISEVYQKSLTCVLDNGGKNADGSSDSKDSLTGNIQTIMSVDAERLREFNVFLPFLIFSPPKCIICIIGLVYVLGWRAALGGVTMMIALIPMIIYTGKITSGIQAKVIGFTDKRVGLLNEVLQGISIVKSFAWESKFIESITHLRQLELNQIINLNYIGAFGHISWHCTPILVSIATFYIYAKLDPNSPKLDAAAAFTAIALLTFLRLPMIELPFVFVKLWEAGVSVNRIEEFLARPDVDKVKRESKEVGFASGNGLGVVDGNFTWTLSQDKNESADETTPLLRTDSKVNGLTRSSFALQNLNLKFKENGLTAIFGATGAGKSSLLQALLGEMTQISGTVNLPRKNVAYVSQTAFISNATIRENILFGEEYDEVRFKSVISACALEKDLEVLASSYKKHHAASEDLSADFIEIGEKGIGLSGGQKQRISLARAAYSKAQYILLDDCLSAVDPPTAKHIFEKCILQFMHGRTRVLATHAVDLVTPEADMVIILRDGVATVEDVQQSKRNSSIPKLLTSFDVEGASSWSAENSTATDETKKQLGKMIQKEEAEEGAVAFSVYRSYMTAASGGKSLSKDSPLTIKSLIRPVSFMTAFLFTLFLFRFFTIVNDYWLREWARAYDGETTSNGNLNVFQAHILAGEVFSPGMVLKNAMGADLLTQMGHYLPDGSVDVDYYINVYLMLGIILLVCIMGPYCVRQTGAYYASKTLHARLLSRVLHAPLRFFSITPIGRIINRFSSDISTLDFQPMLAIEAVSDHSFVVFGVLAVVGYVAPISLLGVIPVAYFYFVVVKGYLNAARQLKRMDSISRSPIYALFTETLTGSPTIRAYDQESRFSKEEEKRVDENNKYFYYMFAATAWLSLNLNIMASFVVFFTGIGIIFTATKFVLEEPIIDAGLSGLALAYTLTLVTELLWLVRFYGMLELSMNAVERVYEYMEIEQEPQGIIDSNRPPANWPERGEIVVKNLVVKYAPETPDNTRNPAILNGISFNVQSFQKVGIIGRTGAGKSTLSLALLRLIPIIDGSVVIDGIDITKIGVKDLRSRITIIPQDPVLFSGTVRSNLDPFEECDDATLYHALKSVHFMDTIAESDYDNGKFNLDHVVSENGGNFSQGQRQLLCLARAMLRNSRVIIMDEATASVDSETDKRIQETIRQPPFSTTTTILIIAHRLKTIADSDKLLVLDKGRISEMGSPKELVGKKGIFRNMCEESGEFDKIMEIIERKNVLSILKEICLMIQQITVSDSDPVVYFLVLMHNDYISQTALVNSCIALENCSMLLSHMDKLPNEILLEIGNLLPRNPNSHSNALLNFSLSAKHFYSILQPLLYASVVVKQGAYPRFENFVRKYPEYAKLLCEYNQNFETTLEYKFGEPIRFPILPSLKRLKIRFEFPTPRRYGGLRLSAREPKSKSKDLLISVVKSISENTPNVTNLKLLNILFSIEVLIVLTRWFETTPFESIDVSFNIDRFLVTESSVQAFANSVAKLMYMRRFAVGCSGYLQNMFMEQLFRALESAISLVDFELCSTMLTDWMYPLLIEFLLKSRLQMLCLRSVDVDYELASAIHMIPTLKRLTLDTLLCSKHLFVRQQNSKMKFTISEYYISEVEFDTLFDGEVCDTDAIRSLRFQNKIQDDMRDMDSNELIFALLRSLEGSKTLCELQCSIAHPEIINSVEKIFETCGSLRSFAVLEENIGILDSLLHDETTTFWTTFYEALQCSFVENLTIPSCAIDKYKLSQLVRHHSQIKHVTVYEFFIPPRLLKDLDVVEVFKQAKLNSKTCFKSLSLKGVTASSIPSSLLPFDSTYLIATNSRLYLQSVWDRISINTVAATAFEWWSNGDMTFDRIVLDGIIDQSVDWLRDFVKGQALHLFVEFGEKDGEYCLYN